MKPKVLSAWFVLLACGIEHARADDRVDFDRDVRPIFAARCYECHGTDKAKGGLRLTDRGAALKELDSGSRAVVPGDPKQSELLARVVAEDPDDAMPPKGERLTAAQVETLNRWVAQGAEWQTHWAYRPLVRPGPPAVKDMGWTRSPIDRFVLATLESKAIAPSPEADRYTLIRRLYADLVGLPPTPSDVEGFVQDSSTDAYEKLVDRLLASPHFGERWGRHWLDKARYADSDGYEKDGPRPDAYRFRDWVIDAVNRDLPFDRFTVEQLAGDLLPAPSGAEGPDATPSQRIATAFHRQTLTNKEGGIDVEQYRVDGVFDRAETTGAVWLGLTVGCARCHSHKYDQITHKEYYGLFAFFNNADDADLALTSGPAGASTTKPAAPAAKVRVLAERTRDPRTTRVLERGDFLRPADPVEPGTPAVLPPLKPRSADGKADRLDLANWLVAPDNPLTPRVAADEVWSHLFGRGLVRTPDDFGVRGERPTHPELLDWLADEYRRLGWSRKALIKTIVTSATYRQASVHRSELLDVDPANRLLARQNRFRVEGEIVRDLALSAGGLLSRKVGGPSVFPPLPADVAAISYANNFKWTPSTGEDRYRRGMYTFFKRTAPHPNLTTFDCPESNATTVQRSVSNTPLQALTLLNNEAFAEAAQALAKRVLSEKADGDGARLSLALRLCVARPPADEEVVAFQSLLERGRVWYKANPADAKKLVGAYQPIGAAAEEAAAWVATVRVMLNLDEFVTRE